MEIGDILEDEHEGLSARDGYGKEMECRKTDVQRVPSVLHGNGYESAGSDEVR